VIGGKEQAISSAEQIAFLTYSLKRDEPRLIEPIRAQIGEGIA
jgi:hypothetical protein